MRTTLIKISLVLAIVIGGWALYHRDQIKSVGDFWRLAQQQISGLNGANSHLAPWQTGRHEVIRIASFNLDGFNPTKFRNARNAHMLAKIIREFDLIAVQEISIKDPNFLKRFVNLLNSTGRQYRHVIGSPVLGEDSGYQSAFIYDTSTIELENTGAYTVNDPDKLLRRKPLVGWFRSSRADREQAFTFSLVNLHVDSRATETELNHLSQLFRAVRQDGRGEDDVIIAGDFQAGDQKLEALAYQQGLSWLISGTPTDTRGSHQFDNIIIDPRATSEFTGESGVFDFMKRFNLTLAEAVVVSDHMPVWAEFTITEEGLVEKVADLPRDRK